MVDATVCSAEELARVTTQQTTTASTARPSRTASLPRRRVCPSPTGAKKMARHGLPLLRCGDPPGPAPVTDWPSAGGPAGPMTTA